MPYCVNCGVELAPSEKACPLCETPVLHPTQPWQEPQAYPYPQRLEMVTHRINRRYGAHLATVALMIPLALSLLVDLLDGGGMTWSAYVLGAGACLFAIVLLPFYVVKEKPYLFLAIDEAACAAYLMLIGWQVGSMEWVWFIGLPLALALGLGVQLAVFLGRRRDKQPLDLLADITIILAALMILVELLVDRYFAGVVHLTWSIYALVPLLGLGAAFRLVERKKKLKETIIKRLFV